MPEQIQTAFVLHRRDYRDTSQIIELFTQHDGRVSVVAKGCKRPKSPLKTSLQMFQPLLVNWYGKHELQTLTHVELDKPFNAIKGKYLAWAFYVNELLYRLLHKHEPYPHVFQHYRTLLEKIIAHNATEADLRLFEYDLLTRIGYGLHLESDQNHHPLNASLHYHLEPAQSPVKTSFTEGKHVYLGGDLIALAQKSLLTPTQLKATKRLLRHALQDLLGDKPIKSRELVL